MTGFLLVILVGSAGCWLFQRLSLPVPGILGSLFLVSILNLAGYFPKIPLQWISWYGNVVIGAYIGLQVNRTSVGFLRDLPIPALALSAGMILLSLGGGLALYFLSSLPLSTALIGSTTGGVAEMAILSISLGADVAGVTLLQVFRLISAILVTPVVCKKWTEWQNRKSPEKPPSPCPFRLSLAAQKGDSSLPRFSIRGHSPLGYAAIAASALAGALAGYALRLPVGILTGAIFGVAATNLFREGLPPMPPLLRTSAQVGMGIVVASNITMETFRQFSTMAVPVILLTVVMLSGSLLLGLFLHKVTGWNYPTCLLSASLGGLSQMAIISEEMGADPLKVSILQTVRLLSILIVLPIFFSFLFR